MNGNGYGNRYSNSNEIKVEQKKVSDSINAIEKAYHAGMITEFGKVVICGIGTRETNWAQSANIHIKNLNFSRTKEALSWFTNIFNDDLRNQSKTDKKHSFLLTQMREIDPVIKFFGLQIEFDLIWNKIALHDIENHLAAEVQENGRIQDWQTRTITREINLADYDSSIMDSVIENILLDDSIKTILQATYSNPAWVLQNAFITGTQGLTLGQEELEAIEQAA